MFRVTIGQIGPLYCQDWEVDVNMGIPVANLDEIDVYEKDVS